MIKWSEYIDVWPKVKRAARTTISREGEGVYPTDSWKKTILLAEHSPIRKIKFSWKWVNLKSWVSVHFVRHWLGILHWVSTQRTDRTGINRDELRNRYYGKTFKPRSKPRTPVYIFKPEDLNNELLIDQIEAIPTARRSREQLVKLKEFTQQPNA
jgi:hypothetical protein